MNTATQTPPRPNPSAFGTIAAFHAAEMAWVQMNDIQAPPVGAQVEFSQPGSKERFKGEIVENLPTGRSRVCCELFAHKREKGQGMLVRWEDLFIVPVAQELAFAAMRAATEPNLTGGNGDSQLPPSDRGF